MKLAKMASVFVAIALFVSGGWALGDIEGSKHDFSNQAWSTEDMCGACHAPHRDKLPATAPLWDAKADLSRRFGTSISQVKTLTPGTGTLMCIRCHDGTIAKDAVGAVKRDRFANRQHPGIFSSAHGTTDHPVGVDYPDFDKGFRPLTTVVAKGTVVLPNAKVECLSCHDPHDTSGVKYMLVTSNARSALCLTCHKK